MKKIIPVLLSVILITALSCFAASAEDGSGFTSEEAELAEACGVDTLPESEYVKNDGVTDIASGIFSVIKDSLTGFYRTGIGFFTSLLAVLIISAALSALEKTGDSQALRGACGYASVLALSGVMFSGLMSVFGYAADSLDRLCAYVTALLPVTASLHAAGGNVSAGVAGSSSLLTFLAVTEQISGNVMMPMLKTGFVISVMSALPGSAELRSLTVFMKTALNTVMAFVFGMFGLVMYFQTAITASADSYAFRTVKFISGAFVPVIGNVIGDAARTVTAAAGTVKASVGAAGLVAVLAIVLPPVIYVIIYRVFIQLAAMLGRLLGLEREAAMLYDTGNFLSVLMSLLIGTGAVFVTALALFIRIGVQ